MRGGYKFTNKSATANTLLGEFQRFSPRAENDLGPHKLFQREFSYLNVQYMHDVPKGVFHISGFAVSVYPRTESNLGSHKLFQREFNLVYIYRDRHTAL